MEWLFVGTGVALFAALGWFLHHRFGGEPAQTHTNVKPAITHEGDSLVGQGQEGHGIGH